MNPQYTSQLGHSIRPHLSFSPQFIDYTDPGGVLCIPFLSYLCELLQPRLFIQQEVQSGNAFSIICQTMTGSGKGGVSIGYLSPANLKKISIGQAEKSKKLKEHILSNYGQSSSLLAIPLEENHFIEDRSIDLLIIDRVSPEDFLQDWVAKMSSHGIVLLRDLQRNEVTWKKLKEQYPHFVFPSFTGLGILLVGDGLVDHIGETQLKFLRSASGLELFHALGEDLLKRNVSTKLGEEIRGNKLSRIAIGLDTAFTSHIRSWRWKIGNLIIRSLERLLLRKKVVLAAEHIQPLIKELKAINWSASVDKEISIPKLRYIKDNICNTFSSSQTKVKIGFAVSASDQNTRAGDYFTALELATACEKILGWEIVFLDRNKDWYQLDNIDILVVLLHHYELEKLKDTAPHLIRIAWVRNRVDEWIESGSLAFYDKILCSSQKILQVFTQMGFTHCQLFPIATNPNRFQKGKFERNFESDVCFTGNYWQSPRDIEQLLAPHGQPWNYAIFGAGWQEHPKFGPYWRGVIPYEQMPDIYASTKLVIDDAVDVTREWDSVNSRVFDALGAGRLVITNGASGVKTLFSNPLPTFETKWDLEQEVNTLLKDKELREDLAKRLQKEVLTHHTYDIRASQLRQGIRQMADCDGLRIAIKIAVPNNLEAEQWGDYHFAKGLKKALGKLGHQRVRIDCIEQWYGPQTTVDELVICLRGLNQYHPEPEQINLLWVISHPDKVEAGEMDQFDHVFVASEKLVQIFSKKISAPLSALLQCTDPEVFFPYESMNAQADPIDYLFIGNSRLQKRKVVWDMIHLNRKPLIYGSQWEDLVPHHLIKGTYIPNEFINRFYSRAKFVLNDHWASMQEYGIVSNRIFDAGACGACIISDFQASLDEIFPKPSLITYSNQMELAEKLAYLEKNEEEIKLMKANIRQTIIEHHTFNHRAEEILGVVSKLQNR